MTSFGCSDAPQDIGAPRILLASDQDAVDVVRLDLAAPGIEEPFGYLGGCGFFCEVRRRSHLWGAFGRSMTPPVWRARRSAVFCFGGEFTARRAVCTRTLAGR